MSIFDTCFTSTKLQILTQKALPGGYDASDVLLSYLQTLQQQLKGPPAPPVPDTRDTPSEPPPQHKHSLYALLTNPPSSSSGVDSGFGGGGSRSAGGGGVESEAQSVQQATERKGGEGGHALGSSREAQSVQEASAGGAGGGGAGGVRVPRETLFLSGMPPDTKPEHLYALFSPFRSVFFFVALFWRECHLTHSRRVSMHFFALYFFIFFAHTNMQTKYACMYT